MSGAASKTICLHGAESSGKTTLCEELARYFGCEVVPEYGRIWAESEGTDFTMASLVNIAATHDRMTGEALGRAQGRVILDTDPLMTEAWAEMLFGRHDPWFDAWHATADLYLLLDIDLPWQPDGTRFFGTAELRRRFQSLSQAVLERRSVRWARVGGVGEARFRNALQAIAEAGM